MITWIKNIAIKWAIKLLRNEIESVEAKNPDVKEFRANLYSKSIEAFMAYSMSKLGEGPKVYEETPIQLFKRTMIPLRDDIEGIINQVLDGLEPKR